MKLNLHLSHLVKQWTKGTQPGQPGYESIISSWEFSQRNLLKQILIQTNPVFFYKALAICRIFWTSEAEIKLMVTKGKRCCKMANLNDSDHMLKITYKWHQMDDQDVFTPFGNIAKAMTELDQHSRSFNKLRSLGKISNCNQSGDWVSWVIITA